MTLEGLIENYGYVAVVLGTFFEGEGTLLLGVFAARQGFPGLVLPGVLIAAFCGALAGDTGFFLLGRLHRTKMISRLPKWHERVTRVLNMLRRHETIVILVYRFLYGFRAVTPYVVGLSHTRTMRFLSLAAVGNVLWVLSIGGLGYSITRVIESVFVSVLGYSKQHRLGITVTVLVLLLTVWLIHRLLQNKRIPDALEDEKLGKKTK